MTRDHDEGNFGVVFGDKVSYRCGVEGVAVVIGNKRDWGTRVRTYDNFAWHLNADFNGKKRRNFIFISF